MANSAQPSISAHAFGQCAVALLSGTSSATINSVLTVNNVP